MQGIEAAYLWARAKMLDDRRLKAKERNEEFHPSDNFMNLAKSEFSAHAVFQHDPTRLVLRLRAPASDKINEENMDKLAATFFGGRKFTAYPLIKIKGFVEKAFACEVSWPTEPLSPS
jgi:hypothetical protein